MRELPVLSWPQQGMLRQHATLWFLHPSHGRELQLSELQERDMMPVDEGMEDNIDEAVVKGDSIHIPIWLVWVYDREIGTSLRAIDTKFEYAKRHKAALEHEAMMWDREKTTRVTIEAREANHMFGAGVLSKIFEAGK